MLRVFEKLRKLVGMSEKCPTLATFPFAAEMPFTRCSGFVPFCVARVLPAHWCMVCRVYEQWVPYKMELAGTSLEQ